MYYSQCYTWHVDKDVGPEGAFVLRQQQSQLSLCCRIHFLEERRDKHFSTFNMPLWLFNQLNVNTVSLECPLKVTTSTMECANMLSLTVNNSLSVPKQWQSSQLTCPDTGDETNKSPISSNSLYSLLCMRLCFLVVMYWIEIYCTVQCLYSSL